ncbi:MAG: serine/threonine protein kinase, partial [Calothrix sp. SM1_7_51]|nr:serine/threonine protein kinase [Calothrix sp. SM1_7_51]
SQNADTNPQSWEHFANNANNLSPQFVAILDKMVHLNPTLRYNSAAEVLDSLENL